MSAATDRARAEKGSRGKGAETEVKKYLTGLSARVAAFDWERIYDARSAGGKFPTRPGDFEFYRMMGDPSHPAYRRPVAGLLEAKETKHDYRLPIDESRRTQIARLYKRHLCGCEIVYTVLHTELGKWRSVPFSFVLEHRSKASLDLRPFPLYDSFEAIARQIPVLS
jgi:hypothetical protein